MHPFTMAVDEGIDPKVFLSRGPPTQPSWSGALILAHESKDGRGCSILCARRQQAKIVNHVAVGVWHMLGQIADEFPPRPLDGHARLRGNCLSGYSKAK